jgi:hypothetical protein
MTPKDAFNSGGQNPNTGMRVKDWYLMGCIFAGTAVEYQGQVLVRTRIASVIDVASHYTMAFTPIPKPPTAMNSEEVVGLLTTVLKQHGPPRCGIVISHSCWLSSADMLKDADIAPRLKTLKTEGIQFGPMEQADRDRVETWVKSMVGVRCEFDPDNMDRPNTGSIHELEVQLEKTWGKRTLSNFRDDANKQLNGTVYEALRIARGPRLVLEQVRLF